MPTPEEQKVFDDAIRAIETKFRIETLLMKFGASEEAAKLISSNPDQAKLFRYDGIDLRFGKSDLTAADDPNAKAHFLDGPFKGLFAVAADNKVEDKPQIDPRLLAHAQSSNPKLAAIAKKALAESGVDEAALKAALADTDDSGVDGTRANGHDKPLDKSKNPFVGLRDKSGKIVPEKMRAVESLLRAIGSAKTAAIAKSAGLRLDGTPIPEQYL